MLNNYEQIVDYNRARDISSENSDSVDTGSETTDNASDSYQVLNAYIETANTEDSTSDTDDTNDSTTDDNATTDDIHSKGSTDSLTFPFIPNDYIASPYPAETHSTAKIVHPEDYIEDNAVTASSITKASMESIQPPSIHDKSAANFSISADDNAINGLDTNKNEGTTLDNQPNIDDTTYSQSIPYSNSNSASSNGELIQAGISGEGSTENHYHTQHVSTGESSIGVTDSNDFTHPNGLEKFGSGLIHRPKLNIFVPSRRSIQIGSSREEQFTTPPVELAHPSTPAALTQVTSTDQLTVSTTASLLSTSDTPNSSTDANSGTDSNVANTTNLVDTSTTTFNDATISTTTSASTDTSFTPSNTNANTNTSMSNTSNTSNINPNTTNNNDNTDTNTNATTNTSANGNRNQNFFVTSPVSSSVSFYFCLYFSCT